MRRRTTRREGGLCIGVQLPRVALPAEVEDPRGIGLGPELVLDDIPVAENLRLGLEKLRETGVYGVTTFGTIDIVRRHTGRDDIAAFANSPRRRPHPGPYTHFLSTVWRNSARPWDSSHGGVGRKPRRVSDG